MASYLVSLRTPADEEDRADQAVEEGGDSIEAVMNYLGQYRISSLEHTVPSDYLTITVKPLDEDSSAIPEERAEARSYWSSFTEYEAVIDLVTGQWYRWAPEEVEQKGGLAPNYRWVRDVSPWELFRLLVFPRDAR
jgi:hypothetical protein